MIVNAKPRPDRFVCVYCGASEGANAAYAEAAGRLGTSLAAAGLGLVYGGGGIGLMGVVARSVLAAGGYVTGIIPEFLKAREVHMAGLQEMLVTKDMHERKMLMFERSDAFVALPGGIGTLEELIEQLTWAQLGRHSKPIVIADIGGFWRPLLELLQHMQAEGFLKKSFLQDAKTWRYDVVDAADAIVPRLLAGLPAERDTAVEESIKQRF
jgi:uncharacterized protein (TIGR00730 family)